MFQYPLTLLSDDPNEEGKKTSSVSLPPNVNEISPGSKDLLTRLLNPNPRSRLKSILALQRIAFFMGCDIQSYTLKNVSIENFPFSLKINFLIILDFAISTPGEENWPSDNGEK